MEWVLQCGDKVVRCGSQLVQELRYRLKWVCNIRGSNKVEAL